MTSSFSWVKPARERESESFLSMSDFLRRAKARLREIAAGKAFEAIEGAGERACLLEELPMGWIGREDERGATEARAWSLERTGISVGGPACMLSRVGGERGGGTAKVTLSHIQQHILYTRAIYPTSISFTCIHFISIIP